jgi:putative salt-induced outer membrane protein YdiY
VILVLEPGLTQDQMDALKARLRDLGQEPRTERTGGVECLVVAPSLIPRRPGDRVKTDRRDALKLARLLRAGDLTAVWVPDRDQEMMRDLSRARDDMKGQERKARQQLGAFVLRHGHHWPRGKSRWTPAHYNWLESLRFERPWQHVVLQEYIEATKAASARVAQLSDHLMQALPEWSLAPVVDSLIALRGIDKLAAIVLLAELGDISRFNSPRELMAFLGLVPSEHTSGARRRQGGITLTGNGHARRMLVESAWSYRFPARQTMHLKRKAVNASDNNVTTAEAYDAGWKSERKISDHDFLYGRLDWRKDRFGGFDTQFAQTVGYGRRLIDTDKHKLNAEVGAGARQSEAQDGTETSETIATGGLYYKWLFSESAEFRQDLSVESGSDNTYLESVTAVKSTLIGDLALVASYTVKHNTDVPALTEKTDTYTALSLEYGF